MSIEGIHNWPSAKEHFDGEVAYLSNMHRHLFTIKAEFPIEHDDRDKEFIQVKHMLQSYLNMEYYDEGYNLCNFNSMSCEMIAMDLMDQYPDILSVEVYEDNENGIRIINN